MSVKWIKITTDIFDDEKIRLIDALPDADAIIVIWFKLLAQAGKSNQNGALFLNNKIAYTDEMLATIFNRKITVVRLALETFEELNMIERGNYIQVVNWEKHQNIEGLEKIREQNRLRQQAFRERQKQKEIEHNVSVTLHNAIEEDIEEDIEYKEKIYKKEKPTKNKYGEFNNVRLTDDEYNKLADKVIKREYYIEQLSTYIEQTGKRYKSHYATILNWHRRDEKENKVESEIFRPKMVEL